MKIAVLADIHANLAALQAVIEDLDGWNPDLVVVADDLVLHMEAACGWRVIRGNHERYVLNYEHEMRRPELPRSGPRYELSRIVGWAHGQVAQQLDRVAALPEQLRIGLGDEALAVYHASLRHDRDGDTRALPPADCRRGA